MTEAAGGGSSSSAPLTLATYVPGQTPGAVVPLGGGGFGKMRSFLPPEKYQDIPNQRAVPFNVAEIKIVSTQADFEAFAGGTKTQVLAIVTPPVKTGFEVPDKGRNNRDQIYFFASPAAKRPNVPFKHTFQLPPMVCNWSNIDGNLGNFQPPSAVSAAKERQGFDMKDFLSKNTLDVSQGSGKVRLSLGAFCPEHAEPGTAMDKRAYAFFRQVLLLEMEHGMAVRDTWKVNDQAKIAKWLATYSADWEFGAIDKRDQLAYYQAAAMVNLCCPHYKSCFSYPKDMQVDRSNIKLELQRMEAMAKRVGACETKEDVHNLVVKERMGKDGQGRGIHLYIEHTFVESGAFTDYSSSVPPSHWTDPQWGPIIMAFFEDRAATYLPLIVEPANAHKRGEYLCPSEIHFAKTSPLLLTFCSIAHHVNPDTASKGANATTSLEFTFDAAKILRSDVKVMEQASASAAAAMAAVDPDGIEEAIPGFEDEVYELYAENVLTDSDKKEILDQIKNRQTKAQQSAMRAVETKLRNDAAKGKAPKPKMVRIVAPVGALPAPSAPPLEQKKDEPEPKIVEMSDEDMLSAVDSAAAAAASPAPSRSPQPAASPAPVRAAAAPKRKAEAPLEKEKPKASTSRKPSTTTTTHNKGASSSSSSAGNKRQKVAPPPSIEDD